MTYILLVVFTALFLFDFALQILDLVMLRAVMIADLRSNRARVLYHGVGWLKSHVFKVLCFWTAVFIQTGSFCRHLVVALNDFILLVQFIFLWLFV